MGVAVCLRGQILWENRLDRWSLSNSLRETDVSPDLPETTWFVRVVFRTVGGFAKKFTHANVSTATDFRGTRPFLSDFYIGFRIEIGPSPGKFRRYLCAPTRPVNNVETVRAGSKLGGKIVTDFVRCTQGKFRAASTLVWSVHIFLELFSFHDPASMSVASPYTCWKLRRSYDRRNLTGFLPPGANRVWNVGPPTRLVMIKRFCENYVNKTVVENKTV